MQEWVSNGLDGEETSENLGSEDGAGEAIFR